ncbi:MAG: glutathionylspermidine synthase family protein [Lachnospiraceae bacterium]|nr:glutathionylspermidine synthase family protein [Lachnospiraceae bacterium]
MESIRKQYQQIIEENFEENYQAALKIKDYLEHSSVAYHGRCVRTLQIPKIFTPEVAEKYKKIVTVTYAILKKVIREYLKNPEYRKLFPFSRELENLILLPRGYNSLLPIARFDIFFNEKNHSFKFCEINTDGTSAMNEDYVLNQALKLNPAHQKMKQRYTFSSYELYDSWVQTFLNIYDTYKRKVDHPHVAIVDFLENASITEFEEFQRRFEKAGVCCEICEITEMDYRNHVLYSPSGCPVDAVYRRAVTTDICAAFDYIQPFLTAVQEQAVCLIGSFCTQIIHNKLLFKLLREEPTLSLLDSLERDFVKKHIPYTNLLDEQHCSKKEILRTKDRWLIKPLDSYASRGVYAGCDDTPEQWRQHVEASFNHSYIYQEYCHPYQTKNICLVEEPKCFKEYTNMSGLFVYDGKFSGIYSRLSDGGIISSQYNEKAVASLLLEKTL